jgi:hypothetical protein
MATKEERRIELNHKSLHNNHHSSPSTKKYICVKEREEKHHP